MTDYCEKLIVEIENEEKFSVLLEQTKQCIDKVVSNKNDTEITKSISIINNLLMYIHIGWTEKELKAVNYFLSIIEDYLIPFKNMSIDGDLRYNFNKNLTYLERITSDNCLVFKLLGENFFNDIRVKIHEDDRNSRKICSSEIRNKYNNVCSQLKKKAEEAKRYISKNKEE